MAEEIPVASQIEIRAAIIKRTKQLNSTKFLPLIPLPELKALNLTDAYEIARTEVERKLPIPVYIIRDTSEGLKKYLIKDLYDKNVSYVF